MSNQLLATVVKEVMQSYKKLGVARRRGALDVERQADETTELLGSVIRLTRKAPAEIAGVLQLDLDTLGVERCKTLDRVAVEHGAVVRQKRAAAALTAPKRVKMTPEQRKEAKRLRQLNARAAERELLAKGRQMAAERGQTIEEFIASVGGAA